MSNTDKYIVNSIIFGIFLVMASPLIVSSSLFFPFITGKNFFFRIIVEIISVLWIILLLRDARYLPRKSSILLAATSFVGIVFVADVFSENPIKSFWSNFERMEGFVSLIHFFLYFLVASSMLFSREVWDKFWNFVIGIGLYSSFYGLLQFFGLIQNIQGGSRLDGPLGNTAYFAGYLLFLVALSTLYFIKGKYDKINTKWICFGFIFSNIIVLIFNTFNENVGYVFGLHALFLFLIGIVWRFSYKEVVSKYLYVAILIFNLFILYNTATRGAIIGLLIGVLFSLLAFILFSKDKHIRKISVFCFAAILLSSSFVYLFRDNRIIKSSQVLSRLTDISFNERTVTSRFMVWNMAYKGFLERPILGWGQESFNFVFNKYYDPGMWNQEPWFDRAHNIFLDWLIAAGVLGLLTYLSLFGFAVVSLWKKKDVGVPLFELNERSVLSGLLIAYFVHNFFVFDNMVSYLMFFSLLAYLHSISTDGFNNDNVSTKKSGQVKSTWLVLVVLLPMIYFFNIRPIVVSRNIIYGLSVDDPASALKYFTKATSKTGLGLIESREHLAQEAMRLSAKYQGQNNKELLNLYNFAISQMQEQIKNKEDTRHFVFLGNLYLNVGDHKNALSYLEKAQASSPQKQTIMFQIVSAKIGLGEFDKALDIAKQAYDLDPNYPKSQAVYIYAVIFATRENLVEELLSKHKDSYGDDLLLSAFSIKKRYGDLVSLWKYRSENDPQNLQYKLSLAASYLLNGNKNMAISGIKEIMRLDPNFTNQGQEYIRQIEMGVNPQ